MVIQIVQEAREMLVKKARTILVDLGLPAQQQNDRTALCLLCLLDIKPLRKEFSEAQAKPIGITPIMVHDF